MLQSFKGCEIKRKSGANGIKALIKFVSLIKLSTSKIFFYPNISFCMSPAAASVTVEIRTISNYMYLLTAKQIKPKFVLQLLSLNYTSWYMIFLTFQHCYANKDMSYPSSHIYFYIKVLSVSHSLGANRSTYPSKLHFNIPWFQELSVCLALVLTLCFSIFTNCIHVNKLIQQSTKNVNFRSVYPASQNSKL